LSSWTDESNVLSAEQPILVEIEIEPGERIQLIPEIAVLGVLMVGIEIVEDTGNKCDVVEWSVGRVVGICRETID
jgi:hypothetical protein